MARMLSAPASTSASASWFNRAAVILKNVRLAQATLLVVTLVVTVVRVPVLKFLHRLAHLCLERCASCPVPVDAESQAQIAASVSRRTSATATHGPSTAPLTEPTSVVVLVRTRRRAWTLVALLFVALTYFVSGTLVVLRAMIPFDGDTRVWQPDLLLWRALDGQAAVGTLAWTATAVVILLEEHSRHKRGDYGRGKVVLSALVGFVTDVALFVGVLFNRTTPSSNHDPEDTLHWAVPQLVLIGVRTILLYPIMLFVLSRDKVEFLPAAEASAQASSVEPSERDGLLAASSPTTGYGAATTAQPTPSFSADRLRSSEAAPQQLVSKPPGSFQAFKRLSKLFPYLWPSNNIKLQIYIGLSFLVLLLLRIVNFLTPLALGHIVTDLSTADSLPWTAITTYVVLRFSQSSILFVQRIPWFSLAVHTSYQLGILAFNHILTLPMSFHSHRNTGELLRVLDRGSAIDDLFKRLTYDVLPIVLDMSVAVLWFSRAYSRLMGVVLLLIMLVYTAVSIKMASWRRGLRREMNSFDTQARTMHTDVLLCWQTVATFANEPYELERYGNALHRALEAQRRSLLSLGLLNWVQQLILSAGMLVSYLIVAHSVVRGKATPGQFVEFTAYLVQLYSPITSLGMYYSAVQSNLTDSEKMLDLLACTSDVQDVPGAQDLIVTEGVVEFRNVHFSYPQAARSASKSDQRPDFDPLPALHGISFTLPAHSACGLAGPSGAGKSTITRLLLRFYVPTSGQILIDGQDISQVTLRSLRQSWGVVPQDPSLFNASARANIAYGRPGATDDEVQTAAQHAQIWQRICQFPEGLDTVVGERGVRLSGGEIQRVALARAFLRDAPLLMLDEASSSLDSVTEKKLHSALQTLLPGRTSLSIAHRLSTTINATVILVIKQGRLVEQGSHEQLLALEGEYKRMWLKQTERQQPESTNSSPNQQDAEFDMGPTFQAAAAASPSSHNTADPPGEPTSLSDPPQASIDPARKSKAPPAKLGPLSRGNKNQSKGKRGH